MLIALFEKEPGHQHGSSCKNVYNSQVSFNQPPAGTALGFCSWQCTVTVGRISLESPQDEPQPIAQLWRPAERKGSMQTPRSPCQQLLQQSANIPRICSSPGRRAKELLLSRFGERKHTSGFYIHTLCIPSASLAMCRAQGHTYRERHTSSLVLTISKSLLHLSINYLLDSIERQDFGL